MSEKIELDFTIDLDVIIKDFVAGMYPNKITNVYQVTTENGALLSGKKIKIRLEMEDAEEATG